MPDLNDYLRLLRTNTWSSSNDHLCYVQNIETHSAEHIFNIFITQLRVMILSVSLIHDSPDLAAQINSSAAVVNMCTFFSFQTVSPVKPFSSKYPLHFSMKQSRSLIIIPPGLGTAGIVIFHFQSIFVMLKFDKSILPCINGCHDLDLLAAGTSSRYNSSSLSRYSVFSIFDTRQFVTALLLWKILFGWYVNAHPDVPNLERYYGQFIGFCLYP